MALTNFRTLLRSLDREQPGGCFFFFGEEFLREEALARTVAAHLDPATRDFNLDQIRGADVSPSDLGSLLATPPLMASWRVVVIRDAQGLSPKARQVVERTLDAPPPGLALVISATIPTGSGAAFYTHLKKKATAVDFAAVDSLDAPGWLIERSETVHRLALDPDAARALVAAVGADLGILAAELDKLADYVHGRGEATLDDVRAVCGNIPRVNRWAWFDLVGERRFEEARLHLPILLDSGESGVGLVIGMTTQLLRIALACAGGQAALNRVLKSRQRWLGQRILGQARRWTLAEADRAIAELLRTDRLLKSAASLSDRQAMEELILRLAALEHAGDAAA